MNVDITCGDSMKLSQPFKIGRPSFVPLLYESGAPYHMSHTGLALCTARIPPPVLIEKRNGLVVSGVTKTRDDETKTEVRNRCSVPAILTDLLSWTL